MGRVRENSRNPDGPNTPPGFYAIDFAMEAGDKDERIYGLGQGNWTCLGGCASGCPQVPWGYIYDGHPPFSPSIPTPHPHPLSHTRSVDDVLFLLFVWRRLRKAINTKTVII